MRGIVGAPRAGEPRTRIRDRRGTPSVSSNLPKRIKGSRTPLRCRWSQPDGSRNCRRMCWGKKIAEWSSSPAEAYRIAVYRNDKYELHGRDPNGYAGIARSMAGKLDGPWFERPIFGQIRYVSAASPGKKFDGETYIEQKLAAKLPASAILREKAPIRLTTNHPTSPVKTVCSNPAGS
jgi:hypothetical protein